MSFTMTETIQYALRGESTSSGKNAGVEATRANLKLAEALPSVSIAVDKTGVFIGNASKPQVPIQHHALDPEATYALDIPLDSLELPQELSHCRNDYTLASLRLGASIIDRSKRFDTIIRCIRELQVAVDLFNYSNTNVHASALLYGAIEERYQAEFPSIPIAMGKMRDSLLATMTV
ncbi:hypothetical protein BKA70DRAFT_1431145 [Coprinopsis sp. MPI-PUGE-AT-0042]|nr:hypothetical protein BKA70DRAFT_1242638 [Coprinopsis sp. MPI-PUGE-AT-0042]KAH6884027.1 hypothetical protein BKA70DRAFT_1238056 [Coprinopsis sp. MPI-PUGE-AT-0042]KAH6905507.1 hypothetical protein BKA70DRAFT_1431145 [Coprinopsis sp. MPI-PUGE-AT-0042]